MIETSSDNPFDRRAAMVAVIGFCVFLNVYPTQAMLPLFRRLFAASEFTVSLTVSATTIAIALAAPAVGLLGEHLGRRRTMVWSLALLTAPVALSALSPGLKTLIAFRFAQGLLMPGIIAVTIAYISEEWSAGGAAAVMSAYVAGNVLGGVTGRFLSGMIAEHFDWRWTFAALSVLNAAGAVAVWKWLPPGRADRPFLSDRPRVAASIGEMTALFKAPPVVATFFIGTCTLFGLVSTFTYITFYLAAPPFELRTSALGSLFAVYLVGVVVTPVGGHWINRLGHRKAYVLSALASATGIVLTLIRWIPSVVVGLAVCSTGIFICQAAATSYLGRIAPRARSSAAGLYSSFYYVGGTLGAAVPAVAWKIGGWTACVDLSVGVLLIGCVIAMQFWRKPAE